ncbi:MAG: 3-dehydroquinate synthase family protein [Candidatus Tumulicola sp.]
MVTQEEDRDLNATVANDDLGYRIVVGDDLRAAIARFVGERGGRVTILCDDNPHVRTRARALAEAIGIGGRAVLSFALGEPRKRLSTVERVLDALLAAGADRTTLALGVGGGVASDLFGFAAATYMRGIDYAHVATSLVAMADAAIGGKTGVDLQRGKNLAGVFKDPVAVFCDVSALQTLPFHALREGLAEVVKAGIVEGHDLFDALENLSAHPFWQWPWVELISAAVRVKTMIVADDRLESGTRELLNLGHTFAHGIEGASEYHVTHGAAVALGLRGAGLLALRTGRFSEREHLRVLALLTLLGMPLRTTVAPDAVFGAMLADKKRRGGRLRFVLPRAIGDVEYGVECGDRAVRAVLERLGRLPEAASR